MDENSELASTSEETDTFDEADLAEEEEGDDDPDLVLAEDNEGGDEEPGNSKGEELLEKLLTQDEGDSDGDKGKDQDVNDKKKDIKQ